MSTRQILKVAGLTGITVNLPSKELYIILRPRSGSDCPVAGGFYSGSGAVRELSKRWGAPLSCLFFLFVYFLPSIFRRTSPWPPGRGARFQLWSGFGFGFKLQEFLVGGVSSGSKKMLFASTKSRSDIFFCSGLFFLCLSIYMDQQ